MADTIWILLLTMSLTAQVPGVGATLVERELRVTLLSVALLDEADYRRERAPDPVSWDGGGFHIVFSVENRPGAPMPPVLGDIRVFVDGRQYNAVSNAASSRAFAPLVVVRDVDGAVARDPSLRTRLVPPRSGAVVAVLDVYVPGKPLGASVTGDVMLEQCETHRQSPDGRLEQLTRTEMGNACADFQFAFSIRNQANRAQR